LTSRRYRRGYALQGEEASACFRSAAAELPAAANRMGIICKQAGKSRQKEMLEWFEKADEGGDASGHYNLWCCLLKLDQPERAKVLCILSALNVCFLVCSLCLLSICSFCLLFLSTSPVCSLCLLFDSALSIYLFCCTTQRISVCSTPVA
jgi:hypothetical protein